MEKMKTNLKILFYAFIVVLITFIQISYGQKVSFPNSRPEPSKRKFVSNAVDEFIINQQKKFKDQDLMKIYVNCFPNTLDTTVEFNQPQKDTFIITGDIEAMWLRDSSFQLLPYINFASKEKKLNEMMLDTIERQKNSINMDAYANAFNKKEKEPNNDITYKKLNGKKVPAMTKMIWERKYELDSLMSPLFFHYNYHKSTGNFEFIDEKYILMLRNIIKVVVEQSIGNDDEDKTENGWSYFFQRNTPEPFDSLHQGRGVPGRTCGLVRSSFRGSDDATLLPFNIPENAFLVSAFKKTSEMLNSFISKTNNEDIIKELKNIIPKLDYFSKVVEEAILKYGVLNKDNGNVENAYFAYEVDCYGNSYFMDDSNYPSLMSLPFIGYIEKNSELYKIWKNTKERILSKKYNPYYFESNSNNERSELKKFEQKFLGPTLLNIKYSNLNNHEVFKGVGSPHTARGNIWPLGIIMRGMTSDDRNEIKECLEMLKNSAKSTGFMHESFNVNDPEDFSRSWFAWANSFFGYFINHVIENYPDLV